MERKAAARSSRATSSRSSPIAAGRASCGPIPTTSRCRHARSAASAASSRRSPSIASTAPGGGRSWTATRGRRCCARPTATSPRSVADVAAQPSQQRAHLIDLDIAEAVAQAVVEADGRGAQAAEERVAGGRELDMHGAPVAGGTSAVDEAGRLHRVEGGGQRRAADADGARDLLLRAVRLLLEREEDEPRRQRAAGGCERLGERAVERLGGGGDLAPDGRLVLSGSLGGHGASLPRPVTGCER